MPKTKKSKQEESEDLQLEEGLTKELKKYEETDFTSLIKQIETEYILAYYYMKPKLDEWALRLKLYNNQKRDKTAVGDPLMFTIHQTVLASLYNDKLGVEFQGHEEGDEELCDNLNSLALYDQEDMEKDILDYEWDFDASFFGRGLVLLLDFDRETKTPIPECVDMMTWLRDPRAKSVHGNRRGHGRMRFGGRPIRLTKNEMKDGGIYFNLGSLKRDSQFDNGEIFDYYSQQRSSAQGLGDLSKYEGLKGDNADYRILEWLTSWKGKSVIVGLGNNRKTIVRYTELKMGYFPLIDRCIYPISHDWDGVSVPDLTEDKQRARSVIQNLGLESAKAGLNPGYFYDTNKLTNRAELQNIEARKFVGVDGPVNNVAAPIMSTPVKQEADWIMNVLDVAAQKATASPDLQQGMISKQDRTLGEINLAASKVDTRYSLSAKIFGWSEKRFWREWYRSVKRNFEKGIDEKIVRLAGVSGSRFKKFTRENLILKTDPDVSVESKVISDQQRFEKLQFFRQYIKDVLAIDPSNINIRFALKRMGKLSGLAKDEIDKLLPLTADEMRAGEENETLDDGKKVNVRPQDDDIQHLDIHARAADTPERKAHVKAHRKNMLTKKERPDLYQVPGMAPAGQTPKEAAGIAKSETMSPAQQPAPAANPVKNSTARS